MCDCITETNKDLRPLNLQLVTPIFGPEKVLVEVTKISSKIRGQPKLFATFCPFCGERYPETSQAK